MSTAALNGWAALWAPALLRACVQGAVAVIVVWAVCRFSRRVPPALRCCLWWLACLKMLAALVVAGPVRLPVLPAAPAESPAVRDVSMDVAPERWGAAPSTPPLPEAAPPAGPETLTLAGAALCVWGAGVGALSLGAVLQLNGVRRLAARARPLEARAVQEVANALGLRQSPPVLVSDRAGSSCVIGPWRPAVLFSWADVQRLSPEEFRGLLAHELAHVRRLDLWAGLIPNAARVLFFFHPLVWLACREYDLAREAACDAEALRVSGLPPADYARLLLKLGVATPRQAAVALGAASPYGMLRRRLEGLKAGAADMPRWLAALTTATAIAALSLHPVRGTAQVVPMTPPQPPVADIAPAMPAAIVDEAEAAPIAPPTLARRRPTGADLVAASPLRETSGVSPLPISAPAGHLAPVAPPEPDTARKENTPMPNLTNSLKPKLSALAALAATVPAAAPAIAQVPAAPAAPEPPAPPAVLVSVEPAPQTPPAPPIPAEAPRYQYTVRQGESYMTRTVDRAVSDGQRALAKAQPGDCLVVDRAGKRYLVTDPEILRRIQENYAPMRALGKQMEGGGKQMEDIGKPMEALGKQMEALGKQMEEAHKAGKPESEIQALSQQMRALGDQMREQGKKMRPIGDQMREYGRQMRAAAKDAEDKMTRIIDTAFLKHLAVEQPQ